MKNIILTTALLFSSLIANAINVNELFKYYKNLPDVHYELIKGKGLETLKDSVSTEAEKEALSSAKQLIVVSSIMDGEQQNALLSKLNTLDDYSLAFSNAKETPEPTIPLLFNATGLESSTSVNIYAKNSSSCEYFNKPIFFINRNGMVALAYLDGKIKPEAAKNLVQLTFDNKHTDSDSTTKTGKERSPLDRLDIQRNIYPQEKLHVVTDRDLYCGSDTIWMRVFVVDAGTHQQMAISKYAYVELLSPFGHAQKRVKLMERDGVYAGYIPVDEDIYEGDYTLTAYTAYAENQGKNYFFRKPVKIIAPYSSKYVIESEFTPAGEGMVKGNFKLGSRNENRMNYNVMSWTMPDGNYLEMADSKNGFSKKFSRAKGEDVVLVKFGDYGKFIPVEYPSEKTEITFYPEGGWLIEGEPCTVAFKATDENGKGVNASGIIRDDLGEEIIKFNTSHHGMGSMTFIPEAERTYTAEYMGPDAELRKAEVGSPKADAAVIRYRFTGSKGTFSVAGGKDKDLKLVIACRGIGIIATPISANTPISIDKSELPTGLHQAILFSRSDNAVLSERLFFIGADRPGMNASDINTDSISVKLTAPQGMSGDCSIRITNLNIVPEVNGNDIRSQLLLQSELRGRIEDPIYYFKEGDRDAERNLDLLMMVNGWSRYNLPEALAGKYREPEIPLEIGQEITGQVRSRWKNKPIEGVMVCAIAPKQDFGTYADTDSDGVFHLNGFDFPEGTTFILKAMNEKGENETNYDIDNDTFPSVDAIIDPSSDSELNIENFFNGSRWIMLDEIKVQAFKNDEGDIFESLASFSRKSEDIPSYITSLEQALRSFPGIINKNGRLLWRSKYVAYYIDGTLFETAGGSSIGTKTYSSPKVMPLGSLPGTYHKPRFARRPSINKDEHDLRKEALIKSMEFSIDPNGSQSPPSLSDIEDVVSFQSIAKIDFIRPENFMFGRHYGGGVIMITTKNGNEGSWSKQLELKDYLPLGYQNYKEYASPMLSVDTDEYDLQTQPTLLWLPSVKFDEAGKSIDLKFPINSNHRIVVEGVADDGELIHNVF